MDGAVRSPQLAATTMRLPAVLAAVNVAAIVVAAALFVAPAAWTNTTGTAAVTVKVVDPEMEPDAAVIVVEPAPVGVASPELLIVATTEVDELQLTDVVRLWVLPSL